VTRLFQLFALVFVVALARCGGTPAVTSSPDSGATDAIAAPALDLAAETSATGGDVSNHSEVNAPTDVPAAEAEAPAVDGRGTAPDAPAADAPPAPSDAATLPAPQAVGFPAGSAARTESKSFTGPITHQTIGFQIYLPPGYDTPANATTRYPTVYDLHGLTGSQFEDPQWVVPSLEAAMKAKVIGPVIVVFPDGLVESYYTDSKDGKKPSETRVVRELVPHVDATYRTVAHRQLRAVTGFSMGGYGAMELATKFPEVFHAGVAYDAALDTWQTLVGRRASIATAQFGDDEAYFDLYSPWANAKKNAAALSASSALRLVPGTTYQMFDAAFRDALAAIPVPLDYVETTCPHDYGCALGAQGGKSWAFIEAAFEHR
jgi:S-formylglutathione hydrolase FrmB